MVKFPERFAILCTLLGFQLREDLLLVFFNVIGLLEKRFFVLSVLIGQLFSNGPGSSICTVSVDKFYNGISKSMAKTFHRTILGLPSVMHLLCVLCLTCRPEKKVDTHMIIMIEVLRCGTIHNDLILTQLFSLPTGPFLHRIAV